MSKLSRVTKTTLKSISKNKTVLKKSDKIWPNFFVTLRVRNPLIVSIVDELSKALMESNEAFETKLVPSRALHVTLGVGRFENDDDLKNACTALNEAVDAFTVAHPQRFETTFHGISSFQKRVLFGSVHPSSNTALQTLYNCIIKSFDANSVKFLDTDRVFHPHLTLAKLQLPRDLNLASTLFQLKNSDFAFGTEVIDEILLCKMHMNRYKDDFYQILHTTSIS